MSEACFSIYSARGVMCGIAWQHYPNSWIPQIFFPKKRYTFVKWINKKIIFSLNFALRIFNDLIEEEHVTGERDDALFIDFLDEDIA
jgi:hypothetical protein